MPFFVVNGFLALVSIVVGLYITDQLATERRKNEALVIKCEIADHRTEISKKALSAEVLRHWEIQQRMSNMHRNYQILCKKYGIKAFAYPDGAVKEYTIPFWENIADYIVDAEYDLYKKFKCPEFYEYITYPISPLFEALFYK